MIPLLVKAFAKANWRKPASLFARYYHAQRQGKRAVWVARWNTHYAGFVTLKWVSEYPSFASQDIPEIKDLNVLPPFRGKGIGSAFLNMTEEAAFTRTEQVGLAVGLYGGKDGGYGMA